MPNAPGLPPHPARRALPAFTWLARTHAASAAGVAAVTIALAGSLFFSLELDAARSKIVLYLALTLLPFAVVAPAIGPAIDRFRGGARWIMRFACIGRMVVAVLMMGHIDSLLLFPEAFAMLVMDKGYQVAKSAYLPTIVASDDALVASNSKLAVLSAVATLVGGAPATLAAKLGGAPLAMVVALLWYGVAAYHALRLPAANVRDVGAETDLEKAQLSSAGVRVASSAMGLLRGSVGFLTVWVAFELRKRDASPVEFAVVLGPLGAGAIIGAAVAPRLRKLISEEWMLGGALAVTAATGILSALIGGLKGAALISAGVASVAASAKLAFDSLVQRDAPAADHGRAFASYEARFQVLWVVGALAGVLLPFPLRLGFATLAVLAIATGALFVLGRRAVAAGGTPPRISEIVLRVMSEPAPAPGAAARPAPGTRRDGSVAPTAPPTPPAPSPPVRDDRLEPTRELPVIGSGVFDFPLDEDPTVITPPPGHDPHQGRR